MTRALAAGDPTAAWREVCARVDLEGDRGGGGCGGGLPVVTAPPCVPVTLSVSTTQNFYLSISPHKTEKIWSCFMGVLQPPPSAEPRRRHFPGGQGGRLGLSQAASKAFRVWTPGRRPPLWNPGRQRRPPDWALTQEGTMWVTRQQWSVATVPTPLRGC